MGPDAAVVEQLIETGFERIIFGLPPADADTVLPMVEKYAALAHSVPTHKTMYDMNDVVL